MLKAWINAETFPDDFNLWHFAVFIADDTVGAIVDPIVLKLKLPEFSLVLSACVCDICVAILSQRVHTSYQLNY